MKFGIVLFPGTWSDADWEHALRDVMGHETAILWHKDTDLKGVDAIVIPGGFSYGDYLRCGAIARFSPIMSSVAAFAERGGPVIGSCNGFQILCEAGLLPGALLRNRDIRFHCETTWLRTESTSNPFTSACSPGQVLQIPISHGEGNYFADPETLDRLESTGRVVFRYSDAHGNVTDEVNPNGSLNNIAGILNERGNVLGMMPHPERVCEELLGGTDGRYIIESMVSSALAQVRG